MKILVSVLIIIIGITIKPYYMMYYGGIVLFVLSQFALDKFINDRGW